MDSGSGKVGIPRGGKGVKESGIQFVILAPDPAAHATRAQRNKADEGKEDLPRSLIRVCRQPRDATDYGEWGGLCTAWWAPPTPVTPAKQV